MITKFFLWFFWDFSGLRFVWEKILPPPEKKPDDYRPPATIAVWIFGVLSLYVILFGLASERYENKLDAIENRTNYLLSRLNNLGNQNYGVLFSMLSNSMKEECPVKPTLFSPISIFNSLSKSDKSYETLELVKNALILKKKSLSKTKFENFDFSRLDLNRAIFESASLVSASFKCANLQYCNFKNATLDKASFENAILAGTDFGNASLDETSFKDAYLKDALFNNAKDLEAEQLCVAATLFSAKMDDNLKNKVQEKCPEKLKEESDKIAKKNLNQKN